LKNLQIANFALQILWEIEKFSEKLRRIQKFAKIKFEKQKIDYIIVNFLPVLLMKIAKSDQKHKNLQEIAENRKICGDSKICEIAKFAKFAWEFANSNF